MRRTDESFRCDKKDCDAALTVEAYMGVPDGWLVVNSHDHQWDFCSQAHAAAFLAERAAKEASATATMRPAVETLARAGDALAKERT